MTYVAVLSHPQARRPSVAGGDLGGVDPAHTGLLPALTGMIGAALGGFGLWLANRMLGKAAFQNAINDGFAKLTNEIQEERDALRKTLAAAEVRWAAERASLQGEIRNLNQHIQSLKSELRRRGVPIAEASIAASEPDPGAVIIESDKP
jgi:hypothetical protein